MLDRALSWSCGADELIGVLAAPAEARLGVLIVVGGPQCRSGSHRMFTLLGRQLAAQGFATLRFDVRGMGDSSGVQRSFEQLSDDIGSAIDTLMAEVPDLEGVVLWGLCDAASAALLYLDEKRDARVHGLVLANPWLRSAATQARTQVKHYYADRLRQPEFWMKLLRGGVGFGALRGWLRARRDAGAGPDRPMQALGFQSRMARGWTSVKLPTLLLLSGNDYTAREFEEYAQLDTDWCELLCEPALQRVDIDAADHTFSAPQHLQAVLNATDRWLRHAFMSQGARHA